MLPLLLTVLLAALHLECNVIAGHAAQREHCHMVGAQVETATSGLLTSNIKEGAAGWV